MTSHYAIVVQFPLYQIPRGARSLYTRASITLSRWWRSANNMLQDFFIIGQSNIPISTAAPTHYVRFYTQTHFLYSLEKFGPFFWGPWGSCPLFSYSPSSATYPHNFSDFRSFSHFLLQGSLVHLHPGLVVILLTSNRGE